MITQVEISKEKLSILAEEEWVLRLIRENSNELWRESMTITRLSEDPTLIIHESQIIRLIRKGNGLRRVLKEIRLKWFPLLLSEPEIYFIIYHRNYIKFLK